MIKTIQQPPVPKAGGDLELSDSYVGEEMAERHPRVVMNLVEYQWNRKSYSTHIEERERERKRRDISAAQKHTASHFLCCSPKTMQEKSRVSSSSYLYSVFSPVTVK